MSVIHLLRPGGTRPIGCCDAIILTDEKTTRFLFFINRQSNRHQTLLLFPSFPIITKLILKTIFFLWLNRTFLNLQLIELAKEQGEIPRYPPIEKYSLNPFKYIHSQQCLSYQRLQGKQRKRRLLLFFFRKSAPR